MWVRSDAREARWSQLVRISTEPDIAIQRERERNRSVNFHTLFVSMRRWKCIKFSFNQNKPKLKNSQRTNSNDKQNPTPKLNHKLSFPKLKPGITHVRDILAISISIGPSLILLCVSSRIRLGPILMG